MIKEAFENKNYARCRELLIRFKKELHDELDNVKNKNRYLLRYGQVLYELEEHEESRKKFEQVFRAEGFAPFSTIDDKYQQSIHNFTRQRLRIFKITRWIFLYTILQAICLPRWFSELGFGKADTILWSISLGAIIIGLAAMACRAFNPYSKSFPMPKANNLKSGRDSGEYGIGPD